VLFFESFSNGLTVVMSITSFLLCLFIHKKYPVHAANMHL
jgi:hypothetical protein